MSQMLRWFKLGLKAGHFKPSHVEYGYEAEPAIIVRVGRAQSDGVNRWWRCSLPCRQVDDATYHAGIDLDVGLQCDSWRRPVFETTILR